MSVSHSCLSKPCRTQTRIINLGATFARGLFFRDRSSHRRVAHQQINAQLQQPHPQRALRDTLEHPTTIGGSAKKDGLASTLVTAFKKPSFKKPTFKR